MIIVNVAVLGSTLLSPQQTSITLLQTLSQSFCLSPAALCPHSRTRPQNSWTPTPDQVLIPDLELALHSFQLRAMDSNLEVLDTHLQTTLVWPGGHGPIKPSSPAGTRPPNPSPSTNWLCLELLSITIMNRICNKEKLCLLSLTYCWQS